MKMQQIFCEVDTCKHFDHQVKCKLKNIQVAPAPIFMAKQPRIFWVGTEE